MTDTPSLPTPDMMPKPFVVRLRHDKGQHSITMNGHTTARSAVASLLDIVGAPMRAVLWVKHRPRCQDCERLAMRYVRTSAETPLCMPHARKRYGGTMRQVREATGELGIRRFLDVPRAEWDPAFSAAS